MSSHGWNPAFANVHPNGSEHPRPYGASPPTMFACRICDKIYLNTHSLLKHYESHEDVAPQQWEFHHRTNNMHCQRDRRDINFSDHPFYHRLSPSSVLQQRYHPYFPNGNGYRSLQPQARQRDPVANTNPSFHVSTTNHPLSQPRNHPVGNNSTFAVSSSYPVSIRASFASSSQFTTNQPTHILCPQQVSEQNPAPSRPVVSQKGFDESADKRTVWYLGQLEQPISTISDLESNDKRHENKLNPSLEL